jgi:CheY-like chemotaxis protein/HPt (histidine-containing phosphotransfer) domain-containing protein
MNALNKMHVLLVEDIPMNYILAKKWLEEESATIDIAVNGRIATEFASKTIYDVILMDIMMPEMSGYEATEFIRNELKCTTPIIAVTAKSLPGEREKCLALGMNEFVTKPYKKDELIQKILETTGRNKTNKLINTNNLDSFSSLIDYSYLHEISSGDQEFMLELIVTFTEQFEIGFQELKSVFENFNIEEIHQISHRLKSTTSMLGIKLLSKTLLEMEEMCQENNTVKLKELMEQLSTNQEIVIKELKKKVE